MVPANVENGDGSLAGHRNLIGVAKDPAKRDEVRQLVRLHEPLPDRQGLRGVRKLRRPVGEGRWLDEAHCTRNVCKHFRRCQMPSRLAFGGES